MEDFDKEEEILNKKLRKLEDNYKNDLFSDADSRKRIGREVIDETSEENNEDEGWYGIRKEDLDVRKKNPKIVFKDYSKEKMKLENKKPKLYKSISDEEKIDREIDRKIDREDEAELKEDSRISGISKPNENEIRKCSELINKIKKEVSKALIGQEEIVHGLIMSLLCNSHVLVEGVPGIAKTLAIRALGKVSGCDVKRIQFTVDMLPTDIIGITSYTPEKGFETIKGPVFTNFLIADEINRAPPKTQSALMEAMQERQVTIGKTNFKLSSPFFVMATENPIENAGVYPLPEAQVDRFLFKLLMSYPKEEEERIIMESNMTLSNFEDFDLKAVVSPKEIIEMQEIVKKVYLDDNIKSYILNIVRKTREKDFKNSEYISYGTSPRASIGLFIASKARALIEGRNYVLPEDVKKVVFDVMRHRLILSYKATIQKITPEQIIQDILDSIRVE